MIEGSSGCVLRRQVQLSLAEHTGIDHGHPQKGIRRPRTLCIVKARTEEFATVSVRPAAPSRTRMPDRLREFEPLVSGPVTPTREVHLGFKYSLRRGFDFVVNNEPHHRDRPAKVGELQVWDVFNDTQKDHPFHLHGFFFQVVGVNGEPPAFRS